MNYRLVKRNGDEWGRWTLTKSEYRKLYGLETMLRDFRMQDPDSGWELQKCAFNKPWEKA